MAMLRSFKLLVLPPQRCLYSIKAWSLDEATQWLVKFNADKIPRDHVQITFSRSSGPGGQNVNKVNSKVDMRLHLDKATWIPEYAREKLKLSNRITKSGELATTSDRTRSQAKNVQDCFEKLADTIKAAVAVPKEPDETTLARVETLQQKEDARRKDRKQRQSQKKSSRRSKNHDY
ncbi:Peptidyl-tRNA hydrolase ict1, mitochondrial [Apophysomyces sp. BC1015]|nr:Peptidyl-tRNA hydrolase ict1, mitochondrial [Apophysomyces sp. BC1015]